MISMSPQFIVIIGLQGAGKSTLGSLISSARSLPFFDTDRCLESKWLKEKQGNIRTLFTEWGEKRFREEEGRILEAIIDSHSKPNSEKSPCIISVGGGSLQALQWVRERKKECLIEYIYLFQSLEIFLRESMKKWIDSNRESPLWLLSRLELMGLQDSTDKELVAFLVEKIWVERHTFFQSIANFIYDTERFTLQMIEEDLLSSNMLS